MGEGVEALPDWELEAQPAPDYQVMRKACHTRAHAVEFPIRLGTGRSGKAKDELLKGAALAAHVGKRTRKGRVVDGMKPTRVLAGLAYEKRSPVKARLRDRR